MPSPCVEVVVPLRLNCPHREAAWEWCRPRYEWPVTIAEAPAGPWCKALAVMPAIERSKAAVVVLADADVWCESLPQAVQAVAEGASWARPHNCVVRLSEEGTRAYMAGEPWNAYSLARPVYSGVDGGGILVAPRKTFLEIPMDPRFVGWGSEDWSYGYAFYARFGSIWRGTHPLIHLWHPPQPGWEPGARNGSEENHALWQRYRKARSDPAALTELFQEARESLSDHQQALHDHPQH